VGVARCPVIRTSILFYRMMGLSRCMARRLARESSSCACPSLEYSKLIDEYRFPGPKAPATSPTVVVLRRTPQRWEVKTREVRWVLCMEGLGSCPFVWPGACRQTDAMWGLELQRFRICGSGSARSDRTGRDSNQHHVSMGLRGRYLGEALKGVRAQNPNSGPSRR